MPVSRRDTRQTRSLGRAATVIVAHLSSMRTTTLVANALVMRWELSFFGNEGEPGSSA